MKCVTLDEAKEIILAEMAKAEASGTAWHSTDTLLDTSEIIWPLFYTALCRLYDADLIEFNDDGMVRRAQ